MFTPTPKRKKPPKAITTLVEPHKRQRAAPITPTVHNKLVDVTDTVTTVVGLISDKKVKKVISLLLHKVFVDRLKTYLSKLSATSAGTRKHYDFVSYIYIVVAMSLSATDGNHAKSIHNVLKEILVYAGCKTKVVCARKSLLRPGTFCKDVTKFVDTHTSSLVILSTRFSSNCT
jgi:hypothetical protein